jgi:hypothetical protein
VFGAGVVAILFMVEITEREQWNPRAFIVLYAVNQKERRGKETIVVL